MFKLIQLLAALCLLIQSASAAVGPGPGEPFGGDDSGCVPPTNAALKCSVRVGQTLQSLTNAGFKCHSRFAKSRFKEILSAGQPTADDEACEAAAGVRFDSTMAALTLADSCAGSAALVAAATEKTALLGDPDDPLAFDTLAGRIYCDRSSGALLSPAGDDTGYVPATKEHLRCTDKLGKQLAKLAASVRKCHAKAAQSDYDRKDPTFDEDGCEAAALAKFDRATANLVGSGACPACLSSTTQHDIAVDFMTQLDARNSNLFPCPDPVLHLTEARLDRPTLLTLGVQLLISGDDNHNGSVSVRYRGVDAPSWNDALPLLRVRPESVSGHPVPQQFAGSIFDLRPATDYEIELHAVDPDGDVDETRTLFATTRAVPVDPAAPRAVLVNTPVGFASALSQAQPGDIITVANGTYLGPFGIETSGTAENPIVIRGESAEATILDGGNCTDCNVFEVYGSYIHIERVTLRNANRALRFQTAGAEGNVVRWVHTKNTTLGFGSRENQRDFYLCDNTLEGRLTWPHVYSDDDGAHSNDDGIHVEGDGHVVCHNQLIGFGDALKTEQEGARAVDFYGNEVLSAYDNGVELDVSEGNVRAFRNRFTNNYTPISFQPIYGGPAYAFRNVVVNVADEQMKFHGLGDASGPSGVLAYHNTFVSPAIALSLNTTATSHHFGIENNLFVGPALLAGTRAVDWLGPIDDGLFDYNGYYPDGGFRFSLPPNGLTSFASFAALQAGGMETHGVVLSPQIFANSLTPPTDYTTTLSPQDVSLGSTSNAIDAATPLPNISDGFTGTAPDLGALERGCPQPIYGVRPEGTNEENQVLGCSP